tara:strand:+ start:79 stop:612 length:534 start_codon:yes stop_codon:yes gene_type:complete
MSFYYKIGDIKTTIPWITPPPKENINKWWKEFSKNDLGEYQVYLGGKVVIDISNTNDVDIILTGPVYDYKVLYNLFKSATELGFKNEILIDICHYDSINFFKYPRTKDFIRYHLKTGLGGEEIKKYMGKLIEKNNFSTTIINHSIPKELAVNLVKFPMEKQIKDGRIYNPILLNKKQ